MFDRGMPVAALMEKVSGRLVRRFVNWLSECSGSEKRCVAVFAGPGHNGGDALVMARELHHLGYEVVVFQPFEKLKPLTQSHVQYAKHLGITFVDSVESLGRCAAVVDGCFGFGLTRPIEGDLADAIAYLNSQNIPTFSIDLPSGIHTDTGAVMGCALKADYTACLGLWKRAFMQEDALVYLGESGLVDFDIPVADVESVLGDVPKVQQLTDERAIACLPLQRSPTAHKYKAGHVLLIAGSRQYAGAALLAGLGAVASGVGMLTLAVPESVRLSLLPQLPGALLIGCEETASGAIRALPAELEKDLNEGKYDAIALGPGLTTQSPNLLDSVLAVSVPLLLDADGLNLLADKSPIMTLKERTAPTVLTPHLGEFRRLFPDIHNEKENTLPGEMAQRAAQASGAIVLLKGPRSAVTSPQRLWFNPRSTPALARGGSGDVLTGLMGGLLASAAYGRTWQDDKSALMPAVLGAVWWHSRAAVYASRERTLLGVDPLSLAQSLNVALQQVVQ